MEVAAKRPPEKVMVLRQPPAAGSDSSRPPAHRPPVTVPPKPAVESAAFNGQQPQAAVAPDRPKAMPPPPPPPPASTLTLPQASGPSAAQDDVDAAAAFDSLPPPPPPPDDELLLAAAAIKEEPISPATAAAAAIERIASKYDTSANATRARLAMMAQQQQDLPATAVPAGEPSPDVGEGAAGSATWRQQHSGQATAANAVTATGSVREARAAVAQAFASRMPSFAPIAAQNAAADGSPQQAASSFASLPAAAASAASVSPASQLTAPDSNEPSLLPPPPPSFASGGGGGVAQHISSNGGSSPTIAASRCETASSDQSSRASSADSLQAGAISTASTNGGSSVGSGADSPLAVRPPLPALGSSTSPLVRADSPRTPKVAAGRTQSAAAAVTAAQSASSSRSGTPPVTQSNDDEGEDGASEPLVVPTETVAVKLTRLQIENKRNKAVPRHEHAGDSKKVSFLVAEKPGSDGWPSAAATAATAAPPQPLMDERRLRTGLSADEVSQAEVFYRSHKTEVRACQCMATLFFADAATAAVASGGSPAGVSMDDWKPAHIGIPVLVYDSGEGKRQRALAFVFAERGTGFQLWRNTMHWQTDYRAVEPTFHQMRAGPPLATGGGGGRKSSKSADAAAATLASSSMAGVAFQDSESAEQFIAQYRQLVEWRPDDNILGDPSLKKKKKKKAAAGAAGGLDKRGKRQPLPSKTAISQPVEFAHITQLKRSEDGTVLPTVLPASAHMPDDLPGKAIS